MIFPQHTNLFAASDKQKNSELWLVLKVRHTSFVVWEISLLILLHYFVDRFTRISLTNLISF